MLMFDFLQKLKEEGDERLNRLVAELAENEAFLQFLAKLFQTKAFVDRQTALIYKTLNIASERKIGGIADRVEQVERLNRKSAKAIETLTAQVEALQAEVERLNTHAAKPAARDPAEAPAQAGDAPARPKTRSRGKKSPE